MEVKPKIKSELNKCITLTSSYKPAFSTYRVDLLYYLVKAERNMMHLIRHSAKNHKRQSVTAKREKSQRPKFE